MRELGLRPSAHCFTTLLAEASKAGPSARNAAATSCLLRQLASSLDASLRQLGNSYNQNHKPKGPPFDPSPGSWGLLQDLHQLHLKLHDVKPPLLGSPPRVAPP